MATIRVFLLTHRRPALLPRALASLRAQTFSDWVCELHNDAPDDDFPRRLVDETGDPRITLHHHERNWGPVVTFNHAYKGSPEPFISILEDDNWWEPTLLARLHAALLEHTDAELAWANLRFWQEELDGTWTNLRRTLWPEITDPVVRISTPQLIQFDGPLHSNGSMLIRTSATEGGRLLVPPWLPFSAMENVRERSFRPPLLLIPEPLTNFAITRATSRGNHLTTWIGQQSLMAAEFIRQLGLSTDAATQLWQSRRKSTPRSTNLIFFAALLASSPRFLLRATLSDWAAFCAGVARHPKLAFAALRARHIQPDLARVFAEATQPLAEGSHKICPRSVPKLQLAHPADLARIRSRHP